MDIGSPADPGPTSIVAASVTFTSGFPFESQNDLDNDFSIGVISPDVLRAFSYSFWNRCDLPSGTGHSISGLADSPDLIRPIYYELPSSSRPSTFRLEHTVRTP